MPSSGMIDHTRFSQTIPAQFMPLINPMAQPLTPGINEFEKKHFTSLNQSVDLGHSQIGGRSGLKRANTRKGTHS